MAATLKKHVESKYVSVFADSEPDTDITFRDDLLENPAEHYQVGVDHLTINAGHFSMFPSVGSGESEVIDDVILEVLRLHRVPNDDPEASVGGAGLNFAAFPADYRIAPEDVEGSANDILIKSFQVRANVQYVSHIQFVRELERLANVVSAEMNKVGHANLAMQYAYTPAANEATAHLEFKLEPSGRLAVKATRAFWSNYGIHVPNKYFQQVFHGRDRDFMIQNPTNAKDADGAVRDNGDGTRTTLIGVPNNGGTFYPQAVWDKQVSNDANKALNLVELPRNLFCTLDRRVCVEVQTSLPIKSSPLVDHDKSGSDFILARYFFEMSPIIFSGRNTDKFTERVNGIHRYADERIQYHQLKPQQKISQLRLRLMARVRIYDTTSGKWVQKNIKLPMQNTDYWACRLHFVAKE